MDQIQPRPMSEEQSKANAETEEQPGEELIDKDVKNVAPFILTMSDKQPKACAEVDTGYQSGVELSDEDVEDLVGGISAGFGTHNKTELQAMIPTQGEHPLT